MQLCARCREGGEDVSAYGTETMSSLVTWSDRPYGMKEWAGLLRRETHEVPS